jgi:hypothetical protein
MWPAVLIASAGCYLLKLAGLSVPARALENARLQRISELIPVALLAALIANQTFATGTRLVLDARAVGLGVAVVAVLLRAPFVIVVAAAAVATALVRLHH